MLAHPWLRSRAPAGRLHLHRGGTSVVLDMSAIPHPAIVHWGEELTASTPATLASLAVAARPQRVSGGLDDTPRLGLVATQAAGWLGTPGVEGHRDGAGASLRFAVAGVQSNEDRATIALVDSEARLTAQVALRVGPSGLLHQRILLRNTGPTRIHRAVDAGDLPRAVGRDRAARHDRAAPARAHPAAPRIHVRHPHP